MASLKFKLQRVLACLTGAGLLLAACTTAATPTPAPPGSPGAGSTATGEPAGDGTTGTISFMIFGDPAEKAAYDNLVTAFKAKYPDVRVDVIHIPDQRQYRQRMGNDFSAGTPADILLINYRRYAEFAAKGALEPLGPYLAKSTLIQEADFYPEAIAPFKYQGQLMCIPQNLSSLVVYYNKDLFDAAGRDYPADDWTWDEFLATAQALTLDHDGDGAVDQYGLGTEASIFRLAPFIWQNGGELVDNQDNPTRLMIVDDPKAREALEWFVALQTEHHVVPGKIEEESEGSETRFQAGRLGMFLNSRRGVPTYREITDFDWDVAALPGNAERVGILHSDAYCMPAVAKNKAAIWNFIEFANSPAGQTLVAASGRTVPSLKSVAESPAFLDPNAKPANSRVFLDTIPVIRPVPVDAMWVEVENISADELERIYYGDATLDEVLPVWIERTTKAFADQ